MYSQRGIQVWFILKWVSFNTLYLIPGIQWDYGIESIQNSHCKVLTHSGLGCGYLPCAPSCKAAIKGRTPSLALHQSSPPTNQQTKAMSTTLTQLTQSTPDAYVATLRAFIVTVETLIDSMTRLMFSDESSFGPVERGLVLFLLESAKNSTATIALFRQANALLGALTVAQRSTLDGLMGTLAGLEDDLEQPVEDLEIMTHGW